MGDNYQKFPSIKGISKTPDSQLGHKTSPKNTTKLGTRAEIVASPDICPSYKIEETIVKPSIRPVGNVTLMDITPACVVVGPVIPETSPKTEKRIKILKIMKIRSMRLKKQKRTNRPS